MRHFFFFFCAALSLVDFKTFEDIHGSYFYSHLEWFLILQEGRCSPDLSFRGMTTKRQVDVKAIIRPHVAKVMGWVHIARHLPGAELEACFCAPQGITKSQFQQIFAFFKSSPKAFSALSLDWVDVKDTFFQSSNVRHRTIDAKSEWISKIRLQNLDWEIKNRPLDVRLNLKREQSVSATTAPYEFIRSKRVFHFTLEYILLTFSIVWAGPSPEACAESKPIYEIEVEILPNEIPCTTTDAAVAMTFLTRILEVQGLVEPCQIVPSK